MKQKLANYISELLVRNGITQNFTVTGGGAMHLNDAFGHQEGMYSLYQHHEQACAMAAESYARIYNRPALLCVTSGPGGTNAITGVLGAWLDSLPMLVISGQVRYDNTARWAGVNIRAMGDQEFDITRATDCMAKYSEMLVDPYRVRYVLEKAIYLSQSGRPGPVWIDIPVNIQGTYIETGDLVGFSRESYEAGGDGWASPSEHRIPEDSDTSRREKLSKSSEEELRQYAKEILRRIREAKRPVFYTGNGIRIAGAEAVFLRVMKRLNIPVVVGWNAPDVISTEEPLYAGRPGGRGDRPGNLTVQNADLILSIGSRLNIRQVGYNFKEWARDAFVIVNDIDAEELRKPSVHADIRIHADARALLLAIEAELQEQGEDCLFPGGEGIALRDAESIVHFPAAEEILKKHKDLKESKDSSENLHRNISCEEQSDKSESNQGASSQNSDAEKLSWLETAAFYRENYPTVLPEHFVSSEESGDRANVYAVVDILSRLSHEGQITVVGNGSACVAGGQAYRIKRGARFISQDAVASMGYDLPAAIGASAAVFGPDGREGLKNAEKDPYWKGRGEEYPDFSAEDIILLTGDGSLQMNLQELQTIIHHRMPIKIFVINNGGYHSIRQTQNSFFGKPLVGIGVDSGLDGRCDLSFPDLAKLAEAYGYPFIRVSKNEELKEAFERTLKTEGPAICEIMVSLSQQFLPKSAAKKLPDGSLVSPPLEDMAPFLPKEEMEKLMIKKEG